jgi:hypothetical protein
MECLLLIGIQLDCRASCRGRRSEVDFSQKQFAGMAYGGKYWKLSVDHETPGETKRDTMSIHVRRLFTLTALTLTLAGEVPALAQSSLPPPPLSPPPLTLPLIAPQHPTAAPEAQKAESQKAEAAKPPARAAEPAASANGRSQ